MGIVIVEIKARCDYPGRIRSILQAENARFEGKDHQVDTYFVVDRGRLKLREGDIENSLIYYDRPNSAGPKRSDVCLYRTRKNSGLKSVLETFLETLVVVDKAREIYFINNVKFHIDRVKDLGSFVEIEAIDEEGIRSDEVLKEQCEYFLNLFKIQEKDLLTSSYSDMLAERRSNE